MQVRDVMTRDVRLAQPEMSIRDAALRMRDAGTGFLPVELDDRLVGTVTDRDVVMRSTAEGQNPGVARVAEAMSTGIVYCFDDQDVGKAAALMADNQVRRLPVLNRQKRLVGVVTIGDIAEKSHDHRVVGHAVEQISTPSGTPRSVHGHALGGHARQTAPNGGLVPLGSRFPRLAEATTEARDFGRRVYGVVGQGALEHPLATAAGALTLGMLVAGIVGILMIPRQVSPS